MYLYKLVANEYYRNTQGAYSDFIIRASSDKQAREMAQKTAEFDSIHDSKTPPNIWTDKNSSQCVIIGYSQKTKPTVELAVFTPW